MAVDEGGMLLWGRDAELGLLGQLLERSAGERLEAVFLVGSAGIGKTALIDHWARQLRDAEVCWGRCWEEGGQPAYWPWIQLLRALADRHGLAPGSEQALVDLITPHDPDAAPSSGVAAGESAAARFRLFDAVGGFLARVASARPLVLVLDDVHAADRATLLLLSFLLRSVKRARILLVATLREVEAALNPDIAALVAGVVREGQCIALRGLDEDSIARIVASSGAHASRSAMQKLMLLTEGNPLFAEEIARLSAAEGSDLDAALLLLPHGVREAFKQRLRRLPQATRELLECASVIGRSAPHDVLMRMAQRDITSLQTALAPARTARVLVPSGDAAESFSHVLMREVIYRGLEPEQRARLHAAAAAGYSARPEGTRLVPSAEILHHLLESGAAEDDEQLAAYGLRAAAEAARVFAFEDAARLLERVTARLRPATLSPHIEIELWLAMGEAQLKSGLDEQGRERCELAISRARALGDPVLFARAALALGTTFALFTIDDRLVALLREALERLGAGDSLVGARVRARLAAALQPAADPSQPLALAHEAIEMARRAGDDETLLDVIHTAMGALTDYADPRARRQLNAEAAELALRQGDPFKRLRAHARLVIDSLELGDQRSAESLVAVHAQLARELGRDRDRWRASMFDALLAIRDGRFDEALQHQQAAAALDDAAEELDVQLCLVAQQLALLRASERHHELLDYEATVVAALASAPNAQLWQTVHAAGLRARAGDITATRAALDALPTDRKPAYLDPNVLHLEAEAAALTGDRERLLALAEVLPAWSHRFASGGLRLMSCEGPLSGDLALVLAALGQNDEAASWFEDALTRTQLGCRPQRARLCCHYAALLLDNGSPATGQARAKALLAEAAALAGTLDLRDLKPQLAALNSRLAEAGSARDAAAAPVPAIAREPAAAVRSPLQPGDSESFAMQRDGELWAITSGTRVFRLKSSRGLGMLAQLIENPDQAFHVLELATEPAAIDRGDAGPTLDPRARDQYRQRLGELQAELDAAEQANDVGRSEPLRAEHDALVEELSRSLGLGGRSRRAASASERARVNVKKRIQHALGQIARHDPQLAKRLKRDVRTGLICRYTRW